MTQLPHERPAITTMYAGLGLTVLAAIAPYIDLSTTHVLADHIRAGYPAYAPSQVDAAVTASLVLLSVVGVLGVASWLWTTWALKAGKRWARPAATVVFALATTVALTVLLTKDTSGDTGLPPTLGWIGMAPCLAGLLAVALLWKRSRPV